VLEENQFHLKFWPVLTAMVPPQMAGQSPLISEAAIADVVIIIEAA